MAPGPRQEKVICTDVTDGKADAPWFLVDFLRGTRDAAVTPQRQRRTDGRETDYKWPSSPKMKAFYSRPAHGEHKLYDNGAPFGRLSAQSNAMRSCARSRPVGARLNLARFLRFRQPVKLYFFFLPAPWRGMRSRSMPLVETLCNYSKVCREKRAII